VRLQAASSRLLHAQPYLVDVAGRQNVSDERTLAQAFA